MIRAVLIGFAHMHVNEIAQYIHEQPEFQLIGCADIAPELPEQTQARYTRAWNLKHVADTFAVPVFEDYRQMLDALAPDIAFILTENFRKPDVVEECAKRGITISVEKPIATTYDGARRIRAAAEQYGVEIFVNWPTTWRPYMIQMRHAMESGIVGDILKMYYVNGHTGPLGKGARHRGVDAAAEEMTDAQRASTWWYQADKGGGAFLDIGCYGSMYSRLFHKHEQAQAVYAYGANLNTPYCDAADNVAAIIRYPKSYSVIEGTWTAPNGFMPAGPVITGRDGVLYCTRNDEGAPRVKALDIYGNALEVPPVTVPDNMKNIAWHYAAHKLDGAPIDETITLDRNMEVMGILDAIVRSGKSGHEKEVAR